MRWLAAAFGAVFEQAGTIAADGGFHWERPPATRATAVEWGPSVRPTSAVEAGTVLGTVCCQLRDAAPPQFCTAEAACPAASGAKSWDEVAESPCTGPPCASGADARRAQKAADWEVKGVAAVVGTLPLGAAQVLYLFRSATVGTVFRVALTVYGFAATAAEPYEATRSSPGPDKDDFQPLCHTGSGSNCHSCIEFSMDDLHGSFGRLSVPKPPDDARADVTAFKEQSTWFNACNFGAVGFAMNQWEGVTGLCGPAYWQVVDEAREAGPLHGNNVDKAQVLEAEKLEVQRALCGELADPCPPAQQRWAREGQTDWQVRADGPGVDWALQDTEETYQAVAAGIVALRDKTAEDARDGRPRKWGGRGTPHEDPDAVSAEEAQLVCGQRERNGKWPRWTGAGSDRDRVMEHAAALESDDVLAELLKVPEIKQAVDAAECPAIEPQGTKVAAGSDAVPRLDLGSLQGAKATAGDSVAPTRSTPQGEKLATAPSQETATGSKQAQEQAVATGSTPTQEQVAATGSTPIKEVAATGGKPTQEVAATGGKPTQEVGSREAPGTVLPANAGPLDVVNLAPPGAIGATADAQEHRLHDEQAHRRDHPEPHGVCFTRPDPLVEGKCKPDCGQDREIAAERMSPVRKCPGELKCCDVFGREIAPVGKVVEVKQQVAAAAVLVLLPLSV